MDEIDRFETLADHVDALWRWDGRTDASFVRAAATALRALDLPRAPGCDGAVDRLLVQRDGFSVRLYAGHGSTEVHSHAEVSAFRLLAGESLHATYRFDGADDAPLTHGELRLERLEPLLPGDVRAIREPRARHALMHLEPGAVSVHVVSERRAPRAFTHLPPGIAYDVTLAREEAEAAAREAGLGDAWRASLEEEAWRDNVHAWRDDLRSPEHRFFLAALLLAPDRPWLLRVVRARFGGDPSARVVRWIDELAVRTSEGGIDLLGVEIPPDLAPRLLPTIRERLAGRHPRARRWDALTQSLFRCLFVSKPRSKASHDEESPGAEHDQEAEDRDDHEARDRDPHEAPRGRGPRSSGRRMHVPSNPLTKRPLAAAR